MTQTPKLIQDTFVKLTLEKPVDKITVREIVETCGVNRNSFYYYYEDIPDLIMSIIDGAVTREWKAHRNEPVDSISLAVARSLQEHVNFCRNLYYSRNKEILSFRLSRTINHLLGEYLEAHQISEKTIAPEDLEIIIQIYRMEILGMVREWIQAGMNYNLEKRILRMNELRRGTFDLMIENARSSRLSSAKTPSLHR